MHKRSLMPNRTSKPLGRDHLKVQDEKTGGWRCCSQYGREAQKAVAAAAPPNILGQLTGNERRRGQCTCEAQPIAAAAALLSNPDTSDEVIGGRRRRGHECCEIQNSTAAAAPPE
jgi:hypothetical protein